MASSASPSMISRMLASRFLFQVTWKVVAFLVVPMMHYVTRLRQPPVMLPKCHMMFICVSPPISLAWIFRRGNNQLVLAVTHKPYINTLCHDMQG